VSQTFSKTSKRGAIGFILVCFVIGLIPMRYLAAPQWDVWVRDEKGMPLPSLNVRLSYENYSAESESHEITLVTDKAGHVEFPSQHRAASLLQRVLYTACSSLGGVHATFGNHAFVFVFGGGYDGDAANGHYVADWTSSPTKMTSTIIAKAVNGGR
jgi:hypothetical protein